MVIDQYTKRGGSCLILRWNKFHVDLTVQYVWICANIHKNS